MFPVRATVPVDLFVARVARTRHEHSSKMKNAEGENVDLYIPRKCSWTNRLIEAKDHASVQINVGHLDQTGVFNGQYTTIALSGYVRNMVRLIARRAR